MEKIKFLPTGLLVAYVLKLIGFGTNFAEMGVVFALTSYVVIKEYMEKHKKMQEVVDIVNKQNEVIAKMATEIDNLKTSMVGVKMGQNFKKVAG